MSSLVNAGGEVFPIGNDVNSDAIRKPLWPAEAPAFLALGAPARLRVPLSSRVPSATLLPRATGTRLAPGSRLCDASPAEAHLALAPVAGTLAGGSDARVAGGPELGVAELDVDPAQTAAPIVSSDPIDLAAVQRLLPVDKAVWIDRIRDAGIHADRRASPDLVAQLNSSLKRTVDVIVCNVLDSDPAAAINSVLAARYPAQLAAGVAALMRLCAARQGLIVLDRSVPAGWSTPLRKLSKDLGLKLAWLFNAYPQSDPTPLLYTLLHQRLRPTQLPTQCGTIVIDAAVAIAIGSLVLHQLPMLSTPLAVRDHPRGVTHFVIAPLGMSVRDVMLALRIDEPRLVVRAGDILRDQKLQTSAVLAGGECVIHLNAPARPVDPDPCIRCGWCVDLCPTRVHPALLLEAAQRRSLPLAERAGLQGCIECGVCVYVCPSRLPLLEGIRSLRLLDA